METTQNTTFAAFESFLKQDYKSCITILNKLKSARTQNEKLSTRIHHNLAIAEFMNGKMSNVNNLLSKLDEVLSEIKTKGPVKRKDSAKGAGASEDDASETSGAEANDETLVKYNYAIALNLAGKRNKSIDLLREIFQSKETVCDYLSLKNALVYLDLAIATKDYAAVKSALEFLENIKKQVGSSNNDISYDNEEEKETIKDPKKEDPKKAEKETRHYNSLIFGGEIYKHGEIPLRVCRTEFDFILNIYHIFLLMSLKEEDLAKKKLKTCKSIYNELTRLAKDGKNEKLEANVSYAASIAPYIEKHASILFSFTKAYMAYQTQSYTKCIKLMNTVEIMGISEEESYTAYQLNNIACCHLRMQKYALAAFYFSKALNILQKQNKGTREDNSAFKKYDAILNLNAIQQYPFIMHNYALALLQLEKFDEATDMYTKLAEYWPDNPRVWYRLALCHLGKYQKTIETAQNQRRNNLYQSLLDSPSVSLLGEEDTKKQSPEELRNKENAVYTRYVLSARDNTFRGSEEESKMSNGPKYTNQDAPQASARQLKCLLDKAAKCFRNASVIARKKKLKYQKDQTLQVTLKPHDNHRMSEDTEETKATENSEVDDDKHNSMVVKLARNIKEYQDILQSSLTYLAFTSLCIGEINNAINYAKGCLDLNYVSDENKYMCFIYLVEAYCLLGKQKEALSQINAMNLNQVIMTCAQNVLGVNQPYLLRTLSSKVAIYTNLASVHLLSNNLTAAQAALDNALKSIEPAQPQTPIPLLNLMVYLNLKLDKPETALQILKRRRVPAEGNKPVLHIVRPVN